MSRSVPRILEIGNSVGVFKINIITLKLTLSLGIYVLPETGNQYGNVSEKSLETQKILAHSILDKHLLP